MILHKVLVIGLVFAVASPVTSILGAAPSSSKIPVETALTPAGQKLEAKYSDQLKVLQAEITRDLPSIDEQKRVALLEAGTAVAKAVTELKATEVPLNAIKAAKGAVEHAKGKWIGGAEKDIAKAQSALKGTTTEADRAAAQAELDKALANKEDGLKALKERQEVLDKAQSDEPQLIRANQAAQATLVEAQNKELIAAKALMANVEPFLASDKRDPALVACAVLAGATPRGLAEFAQQGKEQESLVERLLADNALMKQMLEAGGARGGKYGQAMQIYDGIQKASPKAATGILQRLALGTALHHALPIGQRNAVAETNAPTIVDPVKRYLHYEKAFLDGELDPAFKDMTAWECRMIVNSEAPDHILAWGREMLRNYRPDHIYASDYGWRYSGAVRTDVAYRHSQEYKDTDSLQFFQNIIMNGGICGRRAFFGRYIVKSFGLPTWGVAQHAHAALGRWTPSGWVVNFGAGWPASWSDDPNDRGRRGSDFVLEAQARKYPGDYLKVVRAQCVGDALGEPKCDSTKEGSGGLWNVMALFGKRTIVAEAKAVQLAALGQELGEANESSAAKAKAVAKVVVSEEDRKIAVAPDGVITIPAAACGGAEPMKSYLGGHQLFFGGGTLTVDVTVPKPGKYALAVRVVTVQEGQKILVRAGDSQEPVGIEVPYTVGRWQQTQPVELSLVKGKNVLNFTLNEGSRRVTIKEFILTPKVELVKN
jgi:hypothetical protein